MTLDEMIMLCKEKDDKQLYKWLKEFKELQSKATPKRPIK